MPHPGSVPPKESLLVAGAQKMEILPAENGNLYDFIWIYDNLSSEKRISMDFNGFHGCGLGQKCRSWHDVAILCEKIVAI